MQNLHPGKTVSIIAMLEQIAETRSTFGFLVFSEDKYQNISNKVVTLSNLICFLKQFLA